MEFTIKPRMIFEYMQICHLSQKEFCKEVGISQETLRNVLNNKKVYLHSVYKIARYINVPLKELIA